MTIKTGAMLLAGLLVLAAVRDAAGQPARDLYTQALGRERAVRSGASSVTLREIRSVIAAYERVVHRYPASAYSDNALWQAGNLALLAYQRFGESADMRAGIRLLNLLASEYPSSSLVQRVKGTIAQFEVLRKSGTTARAAVTPAAAAKPPQPPAEPRGLAAEPEVIAAVDIRAAAPAEASPPVPAGPPVTIRGITRTRLPDGVRISIEMERELLFHQEHLENPRRLFFDLRGSRLAPSFGETDMRFSDDLVREIRLGRHAGNTTRIVLDTEGVESYSVFTLYNPFRVIVDFRRAEAVAPPAAAVATTGSSDAAVSSAAAPPAPPPAPASERPSAPAPLPSRPSTTPGLPAPEVPAANSTGKFSLSRQLGLGVSRIVLDPGHGGHDPGAKANGIGEAELVLDVALRLKKLLEKQPGIEVVMTRETDVFIPLEQRTAIANREGADLFLSIHANASRNTNARGVETYFLNFATNPEAEAVAARENSASGRTMHSLPEIVRAIALNNKIDESRDFAATVQKAMIRRLSAKNANLRDLGVKQAPFVVLIGAGMPSVLAEISFVTHKQESQLLKTAAYRQAIAEALLEAIVGYQRSLKAKTAIAAAHD